MEGCFIRAFLRNYTYMALAWHYEPDLPLASMIILHGDTLTFRIGQELRLGFSEPRATLFMRLASS